MGSKISFIGSGNVATNMAHAFDKAGHTINQVVSHNIDNAKTLASKFGAYYGDRISELYKDSDFIVICVNDEAYIEVMQHMPKGMKSVICHTAGPVSMNVLDGFGNECGVLYPLQSFRKEELKDFLEVPVFVEGSSVNSKNKLCDLADSISNRVKEVSSEHRAKYHLAAVFANNFTNLMYGIADDYLEKEGLDFSNLIPIIEETAQNIKKGKPTDWQTGPAKRGDKKVINKHIEMLSDQKVKDVYRLLSDFLMTIA
ncbi:DUF2520 domain-containing protein [Bacteroidia bacterium]|nr:DUF2520 domain-containing protein [Bacteroidia bacterium]